MQCQAPYKGRFVLSEVTADLGQLRLVQPYHSEEIMNVLTVERGSCSGSVLINVVEEGSTI
eukprot:Awhi_evm1s2864